MRSDLSHVTPLFGAGVDPVNVEITTSPTSHFERVVLCCSTSPTVGASMTALPPLEITSAMTMADTAVFPAAVGYTNNVEPSRASATPSN